MAWGQGAWSALGSGLNDFSKMLLGEADRRYKRKRDDDELERLRQERKAKEKAEQGVVDAYNAKRQPITKTREVEEIVPVYDENGISTPESRMKQEEYQEAAPSLTMQDINDIAAGIKGGFNTNAYGKLSGSLNTQSNIDRRNAQTEQGQKNLAAREKGLELSGERIGLTKEQQDWSRQFKETQQKSLDDYRKAQIALGKARLALQNAKFNEKDRQDLDAQLKAAEARVEKINSEIAAMKEPDIILDQKGLAALRTKNSELLTALRNVQNIELKIKGGNKSSAKTPPNNNPLNLDL